MGKKLLIAAGTAHYDNVPVLNIPGLEQIVSNVADFFTRKLGYIRVLEGISNDPTSKQFGEDLDRWLGSRERDVSDWIVLYYTGHGELVGTEKLYFLTRNYTPGLIVTTAFRVDQLGDLLVSKDSSDEYRKVKRVLVILDTCYSGVGARELSSTLNQLFSEGFCNGMFYVLAASFPKEQALAGGLANALMQSLEEPSLAGVHQKLIYFDQLIPAINRKLKAHKVVFAPVLSPDEEPQFFPNPNYVEWMPQGATVAEARRALESGELVNFWGPISRGVELEFQPGWYFTGRKRVLGEISDWLKDSTDNRTRVITGQPGSGKSAILSKIVTISDPAYRRRMPKKEQPWIDAFPANGIHLAVYAKGKTLQEITSRVAARLGVAAEEPIILAALKTREQPFHFVLDALDEAREPDRVLRELLEPMHSLPNVKLLVGTRPEQAEKVGQDAVRIYVDKGQYLDKNDLRDYVEARLLRRGEKRAATPYKGRKALAVEVAMVVAEKAHPNFLIARLVAEDLLSQPEALDQAAITSRRFPDTVSQAFTQYLTRFGAEEQKARDLLTPLAWAEGVGLPWGNIWPTVASALSGRAYSDEDVRWVLDRAGSFVVEALESDRSVYRLYHQALADYLRQGREMEEVERVIVQALLATVPTLADDESERKDWQLAHPYILDHLAEHAAACKLLNELATQPLFLLTADPNRLLSVIEANPQAAADETLRLYKTAFHHLRAHSRAEAASYLMMAAAKSGLYGLVDQIAKLPLGSPWSICWARWRRATLHRILAGNLGGINSLAVTQQKGRTLVISGSTDGTIRLWDLENDNPVSVPLAGHTGKVYALVVAERRGRAVIISGGADGTIRLWDLDNGHMIRSPLRGHAGEVRALVMAERRGRAVIISGGADGTIRLWDLDNGNMIRRPLTGHTREIDALAVAESRNRVVIVSNSADHTIGIWDLGKWVAVNRHSYDTKRGEMDPTEPVAELNKLLLDLLDRRSPLIIGCCQGHRALIFGAGAAVRIWDMHSFAESMCITGHTRGVSALAVTSWHDKEIVISGSNDKTILLWDYENGGLLGTLQGHTADVQALVVVDRQQPPLIISGSTDGTIRRWNLENIERVVDAPENHQSKICGLATAKWRGRSVVISCSQDHAVRIWDLQTGNHLQSLPNGKHLYSLPTQLATGLFYSYPADLVARDIEGRLVIVVGTLDRQIVLWDPDHGGGPVSAFTSSRSRLKPIGEMFGGIKSLALVRHRERTLIVCSCYWDGAIRIFDLENGEHDSSPLNLPGEVGAFAVIEENGHCIIISGCSDGRIWIWDLDSYAILGAPLRSLRHSVTALAVAEWKGRTVIVSGNADGCIGIWDLDNRKPLCDPTKSHADRVSALTVAKLNGKCVVISGSYDQSIRTWDIDSFTLLQTIQIEAPVYRVVFAAPSTIVVGTSMGLVAIRLHEN